MFESVHRGVDGQRSLPQRTGVLLGSSQQGELGFNRLVDSSELLARIFEVEGIFQTKSSEWPDRAVNPANDGEKLDIGFDSGPEVAALASTEAEELPELIQTRLDGRAIRGVGGTGSGEKVTQVDKCATQAGQKFIGRVSRPEQALHEQHRKDADADLLNPPDHELP